jgi:predicted Zn-dependent peptidase
MSSRGTLVLIAVVVLASIAIMASSAPAASQAKPSTGVQKTVLGNGLTVLVKESAANEIVSVQLILGMGAKFESDAEAGISKLLQQSLLKGTSTRTAEQIANEIESVGGRINSGSTKEVGFVSFTCTKEALFKAQEVFFDVVSNPSFPEAEVEKERSLILQNIKQRRDQLLGSTIDLAQEVLYGEHPFHKPADGYEETVGGFTRAQVQEAYKRFYVPQNMVVCAVGNLNAKKFVKEVEKRFKGLKGGETKLVAGLPAFSLVESRQQLRHKKSASAWLVIAFPAPGISQNDYFPARVLDSILGGSMHSRLFTELRDKQGLGYQVGSFFANYSRDAFMGTYIGTRPDQYEVAKNGILAEIEKVRGQEVTDEELNDTKTFLRGSFIIGLESNESQSYNFAYYECLGVGYDFTDRYLEGIQAVQKADMLRLAKERFGTYGLASTLPEETEKEGENAH